VLLKSGLVSFKCVNVYIFSYFKIVSDLCFLLMDTKSF